MNEYYSCNIIENGFDAQVYCLNLCCRVGNTKNTTKLSFIKNFDGKNIDFDLIKDIRNKIKESHKKGKFIAQCKGCVYLEKKDWDNETKISTININNWIKCNAKCIYCDRKEYEETKSYDIYPIIKYLIENNELKNPADITIAGGEPTITKDFDNTIKLLLKHEIKTVRVLTNAIKYNKYIEEGLKKDLINIMVSTDSGRKETYKKIKLVDKHNEVWKNIKNYAKHQKIDSLVKTKYIILPEINNNKEELNEFIKRNIEAGVKHACIDLEINFFLKYENDKKCMKEIYDLFLYTKDLGLRNGINVEAFDRIKLIENFL